MHDPGIVEENVELSELILGSLDHRLAISRLRNVGVLVDRLAAGLLDQGDRFGPGLGIDVGDHDPGTLRGEG